MLGLPHPANRIVTNALYKLAFNLSPRPTLIRVSLQQERGYIVLVTDADGAR
jgi:hypothetical protein